MASRPEDEPTRQQTAPLSQAAQHGDEFDPFTGQTLGGRYRIGKCVDAGGLGRIYVAEHLTLARPVAIKVMRDEVGSVPELRLRFEREAKVLSTLSHPNIVQVTDYGVENDRPYLVMELLEGKNLADLMRDGPLVPTRVYEIGQQVMRGLVYAHAQGVLHRDLKPANIFVRTLGDQGDHVKLLDFGLAKFLGPKRAPGEPELTTPGVVAGSPSYLAPEMLTGQPADVRSDVYSLGVILFEMFAGRRPFVADTPLDIMRAHLNEPVPRINEVRPDLPGGRSLQKFLMTAMAKSPNDRFQDVAAMLDAFDALATHTETLTHPAVMLQRKRAWVYGGVALAMAALVFSIAIAVSPPSEDDPPAATNATVAVQREEHPVNAAPASQGTAEPSAPEATDKAAAATTPEHAPTPQSTSDAVGANDSMWRTNVPPLLVRFKERIDRGVRISEDQLKPLYDYIKTHPKDPRPHILVGHAFANIKWRPDAINRYKQAFEVDPSAIGDSRMLKELLRMVLIPRVATQATNALIAMYGPKAVPALDTFVAYTALDIEEQQRLKALRRRLQAKRSK